MRSSSAGRKSSTAPSRASRDDKGSRSEARHTFQPKTRPSSGEGSSGIPRPRIRSDSSERNSIRRSNLKPAGSSSRIPGASQQTPTTPRVSNMPRVHSDLPTGLRAKSPSVDRASTLSKAPRKDTRPLKDKQFQSKMLERIDTYFRNINDPRNCLNKNGSFKPASISSFITATALLLEDVGVIVKPPLVQANYVEEIPKYMKKLHYPAPTSKFLPSVNLQHALPDVLGWLSWLVEMAEVRAIAAERWTLDTLPFVDTPEYPAIVHRNLFETYLELYTHWNLKGVDEEAEKKIQDNYVQKLAEHLGATPEALARAEAELAEVQAKSKLIDEEAEAVDRMYDEMLEKLTAARKEEAEQLEYLAECEEEKKKIKHDLKMMDEEEKQLDLEQERLNLKGQELELIIEQQEMSAEERDEYEKKCKELKIETKRFDDHLEEIKKEIYSLEIKLAKAHDGLSKAILGYNRSLVCELPESILGKKISELQMPESFRFDENIFEKVKEKAKLMNDLRGQMTDEINRLQPMISANVNKLEELEDRLKAINQAKLEQDEQNQEAKQILKELKQKTSEEEAKIQKQIKKLEDEIREIRKQEPDLEALSAQLDEVNEKVEARLKRKAFLEQSAERFFARFYATLASHKSDVEAILSKLDEFD